MDQYFNTLGLQPNSTLSDVKSAFRRLSLIHHPDKNGNSEESNRIFKEIINAYDILNEYFLTPEERFQRERLRREQQQEYENEERTRKNEQRLKFLQQELINAKKRVYDIEHEIRILNTQKPMMPQDQHQAMVLVKMLRYQVDIYNLSFTLDNGYKVFNKNEVFIAMQKRFNGYNLIKFNFAISATNGRVIDENDKLFLNMFMR